MKEKTPCEELGYKVGDKFTVLESVEGFTLGQEIMLYRDDGTNDPLFIGQNSRYNNADGKEGAYLDIKFVKKIVQEKEMKSGAFNLKTNPWFIRVNSKEEFEAAKEWVKSQTGDTYNFFTDYYSDTAGFSNYYNGKLLGRIAWYNNSHVEEALKESVNEIKLTFKTVIDSVEYPVVKELRSPSERDLKIEELEQSIKEAQERLNELKEMK